MGRSVLPRYRLLSVAAGRSPCPLSEDDVSSFCSSLSEELKRLEQLLVESSISLRWSVEAMNLLKKTQTELIALLKKSKLPVSYGAEEDWFDRYMKETTSLLDVCNSLKSAVSEINRYRVVVGVAVQKLNDDAIAVKEMELERLERERKLYFETRIRKDAIKLEGRVAMEDSNKLEKSIDVVMFAAKSTMIVISLLLISAFVSPISIDMGSWEFTPKFHQLKPFMPLLPALVSRFRERISRSKNGSGLILVEHEMVDRVVGDLKAQMVEGVVENREEFLSAVDELRTGIGSLREGIEMFDAVVDGVFEVVIKGRNEMLENFRDGAPTMG